MLCFIFLGIFVVFISYCRTYPYPFIAWFLKTQLFLFYLYTCIIWLEVRNRAQKTLPKGRPVHRLLYVIGYLLRREGNVFVLSWDCLLFFLHEKHLIYLLLINSMIHVAPSPRLHFWGIHANEVSALQAATILVLMVRRIEQKRKLKL